MRNRHVTWLVLLISMAVGFAGSLLSTTAFAKGGVSKAPIFNWWDGEAVVGQTVLHRSADGLKADIKINTGYTDKDRVITLWFMVFNTPEGCAGSPCTPNDLGNPDAGADFLYGGGIITTQKKAQFGGSLATGDVSGSGFIEIGFPGLAHALLDPMNAEVLLALHSHGPSASGEDLKMQISSFLGGCVFFLGEFGFAGGPEDVPDEPGECSTFMYSLHQP